MSAAPNNEPPDERPRSKGGVLHRGAAALLVIGVGAFGMFDPPAEGAVAPPAGTSLTRRYDPMAAVTVFTLDVGEPSPGALDLVTCPGVRVLRADGPGGATVTDSPSGTKVSFPSEAAGTYRVVLAGDRPGLGVGQSPGGCVDSAVTIDPAAVTRGGAEVGPSTRIAKRL